MRRSPRPSTGSIKRGAAVRFVDAMVTLENQGVRRFLECGPAAVLSLMGQACLAAPERARFTPSLQGREGELAALAAAVGALHVSGCALDRKKIFHTRGSQAVDLPGYAFQRQPYWLKARPQDPAAASKEEQALWAAVLDGESDAVAELLSVPAAERDKVRGAAPPPLPVAACAREQPCPAPRALC
jgi:acyl transferase domain-containing protein